MPDASQLVAQICADLKPLERKIIGHPCLVAIEEGHVMPDLFKVFVGQQYHIIGSDLRSIAMLISRHGTWPSRNFLVNLLQGEVAALKALLTFAAALSLSAGELETFEPIPAAHAYCAFVAWLALYGSDAELAGAFLVNLSAWGANCGRMRQALHEKYGFPAAALTFFDLFASMPTFETETMSVIQSGLNRGISPRAIHRAARMLQSYELMYWDAMADAGSIRRNLEM